MVFVVGGGNGDVVHAMTNMYGSNIFVFEGIPKRYEALNARFESVSNVRVLPFYLSDVDEFREVPVEVEDTVDARSAADKDEGSSGSEWGASRDSGVSAMSSGKSWTSSGSETGSGSLLAPPPPPERKMMRVEFKSLPSEVQRNGIHTLSLLHLDCNGCEYDVLDYLTSHKNRVEEIQFAFATEEHTEDALTTYCHLQKELATEFRLRYRYPYVFESWVRK